MSLSFDEVSEPACFPSSPRPDMDDSSLTGPLLGGHLPRPLVGNRVGPLLPTQLPCPGEPPVAYINRGLFTLRALTAQV